MTANQTLPEELAELGRVHFVGVGGVGMSAVARVMLARGVPVSGSDAKDLPVMAELASLGARIAVGYTAANVGDADTVVRGSAIRPDNPELVEASARGLRILHRSEALAAVMAGSRVIAVAGTHGKTTTTSMTAWMLRGAGLDPSFAIGANVPALGANAAAGETDVFVAEADESDESFLNYRPLTEVITNVEADHLDHYGTADAVHAAFDAFAALVPEHGLVLACADDPGALALARRLRARADAPRVLTYGTAQDADLVVHFDPSGTELAWEGRTYALPLRVPGLHNALNAAGAFAAAVDAGADPERAAASLSDFSGAARRFEFKGEAGGVRVFDDYAHHPTEVRAALAAARAVAGGHSVHVLFQPHLFSRTREFAEQFAEALSAADTVRVMDIYPAREDPIPGVTSELVTARLTDAAYAPRVDRAVAEIAAAARPGDIVLTVGAGDVTFQGRELLAALAAGSASVQPSSPEAPHDA
ncbi:UDP-N-acetylmuramate--L-alanine ligase [Sinomonas cellulolyticus]|uniref:UDP-N-acetylmuramate--L-alanine ligase n=1 Tax=Sinomonas cellulolyticus TaxID=2801916 RepID=A0ABS1K1K6_9MICC|nr:MULTISPECIES: UDP-N-acetylmuramate--L-alanine ligase [Sinomonas]MBL0705500.1 UDP-N-acetylmuramate--L-alanine ligase [Sinomonas cellulolyticus]GHG41505.1 UDP-N-acetylmuramate--L-alanine ligase [Sinomonas sp. KCTC 49339]